MRAHHLRMSTWAAAFLSVAAFLASCASGTGSAPADELAAPDERETPVEETTLDSIPDIVAMVPEDVLADETLRVGVALSNPPSALYDEETGQLAGVDVEIAQAVGETMGLANVEFVPVAFSRLLQQLGIDYEMGAAVTAVTSARLEIANFVTYAETGSTYFVKLNNPHSFSPDSPCGRKIAVQANTVQQDQLDLRSAECINSGDEAIASVQKTSVDDVLKALSEDEAVAAFSDAIVTEWVTSKRTSRVMQIGQIVNRGPVGLSVSADDPQLTVAVHAAVQVLMDEGYIADVLTEYGIPDAALTAATINPKVD